jgi:geranylgeranyl diphosphate synthase type II
MAVSDDLHEYMESRQALVEARLREVVPQTPGPLAEAMSYSLLAPGKRLRPLLVLMACEAGGGRDEQALPAACAVEMIHTYSLIHDDLPAMDDDALRRGQPTCHKKFGEALAILAGDALLTLAFQVLAEGYPPATAAAACAALARGSGAAGMVGGQVLDLAAEKQWGKSDPDFSTLMPGDESKPTFSTLAPLRSPLAALEEIHALKTGALFRSCLQLGALAAQGESPGGPEPALAAALDGYGRCFGLVFQITDDLLDVEGDAAQTGKNVQKDAARGKLTYPVVLGVPDSRRHAEDLARQADAHLRPLGRAGQRLEALIRFILARDR